MVNSGLTVEFGVILTLIGISVPLFIKASNDMKKAAEQMAEMRTILRGFREEIDEHKEHNYRDIQELKESHRTVFQFLLNNSQSFRESKPRRND